MSKFKEGDIIVKNDYTYVCRIVGETEALFEKRWFKGLFKNPENSPCVSGCGDEGFSCNDTIILFSDKCRYLVNTKHSNNKNVCSTKDNLYPVIGTYIQCQGTPINLEKLKYHYPEAYKNYITSLYDRLPKEQVEMEVKKKNKKSKK